MLLIIWNAVGFIVLMIKYDEFCVHCLKVCDLPRHPDEEARSRCVRIIEILISAKANINPLNSKGSTPLM